ncbi:hypothetical protein MATL_G00257870 [Megalops atlanticus]|uniref:Uncharacterized protein n=1 Tax=Megalops atlanticus TaxID=7932 RepID=A0A9D3T0K8_MEGAT|nr:hypothetical protein MATL_G00257870 [Megalops atlanticus]
MEQVNMLYKWSDDVERLIRLRQRFESLFSGRRNAAQHGWEVIMQEMGLETVVSPARVIMLLKCNHQHLRSRHSSCQLLPHLLPTGIRLLLMRLVVIVIPHD